MAKKKKKEINREIFKKEGEDLQQWLIFTRRGSKVKPKKGRGSFERKKKNWGDEQ